MSLASRSPGVGHAAPVLCSLFVIACTLEDPVPAPLGGGAGQSASDLGVAGGAAAAGGGALAGTANVAGMSAAAGQSAAGAMGTAGTVGAEPMAGAPADNAAGALPSAAGASVGESAGAMNSTAGAGDVAVAGAMPDVADPMAGAAGSDVVAGMAGDEGIAGAGMEPMDTAGAGADDSPMAGADMGGGVGSAEPCGASGLTFCTDFESGLPAELTFYPEYQQPNMANFVAIDGTAHSGSSAVKFIGSDFSQMLGVATPGAEFWGRVYLRSDTDIQSGHNTYVAATDGSGDPNDGEQIRIGEHQCQLELNRRTDDAEKLSNGGTYECSGGITMTAGTWYCLEFHYNGPGSEVQVFVDSTEVDALHVTDWGPYNYSMFKFGFEKYHGDAKNLWFDDLALGTQRVGCIP